MHFIRGGHTAGEDTVLKELARLSEDDLIRRLPSLPPGDSELLGVAQERLCRYRKLPLKAAPAAACAASVVWK